MDPYKRIYTAQEYKELQNLNEAALEQNKLLKRQLDEVYAAKKKVELPTEVAAAIESFQKEGRDVDYIISSLINTGPGTPTERLTILRKFSLIYGDLLVQALANGYTIEQTPAEKLHAKIEQSLKECFGRYSSEQFSMAADKIMGHVKEILA